MISDSVEYFNIVLQTAIDIDRKLIDVSFDPKLSFEEVANKVYKYYNDIGKEDSTGQKLDRELSSKFMFLPESRLQDRFANYLIANSKKTLIPLYNHVSSVREDFEHQPYGEGHMFERLGYTFFAQTETLLNSWIYIILRNVEIFAPECHAEYKSNLRNRNPVYDEWGDEIYNSFPFQNSYVTEHEGKNLKETPTKNQILLLHKLGVFDAQAIKNLTTENKGKLFAWLLNRNEKNVTECIRNCDPNGNKQAVDNPYIYENKVAAVNQLLKDVGYFTKL